jgi:dihydrofolate synthase/folylpolyglutamate synthase
LGGRLDATNVVTPEICAITPISRDHTAYLGDNLQDIAAEKAGIFKPGVTVISGYQEAAVDGVLAQQANQIKSPLFCFGEKYHCHSNCDTFSVSGEGFLLENVRPQLAGEHQQQNLALAAAVIHRLVEENALSLSDDMIRSGLEKVRWPGRLEWLPDQILLDGAHNPAGAKTLTDYLRRQQLKGLHLVVGCKADKQAELLLTQLLPFVQYLYATSPPVDEAVSVEKLVQLGQKSGILANSYAEPLDAMNAARANRSPGETILVAGSLFLIAAVRELLLPEPWNLALID